MEKKKGLNKKEKIKSQKPKNTFGKSKMNFEGLKKAIGENKKRVAITVVSIIAVFLIAIIAIMQFTKTKNNQGAISPELAKAMEYPIVEEGDEKVEGTDNVKFDAFFLRDINQDGNAESIRGTSKQVGKEDTLYMELNVLTAGSLEDAKITINGENFYLQTTLPKDKELKDNYIGNNIKEIEFNTLNNGTQKLLTGIVRSGDYSYTSKKAEALGNNINNYSKENSVTLTGTYVAEDGTRTPISKTVKFDIDWYGVTVASIYSTTQNKSIEGIKNEEQGTVTLDFTVNTQETKQELMLKKNHVEGQIPDLNGYPPAEVIYTGTNGSFNYDAETKTFTIDRESKIEEDGTLTSEISSNNSYSIRVVYPIEAYEGLGTETIELRIPVTTYFEGYNNQNDEFTNPYVSNTAKSTIVVTYVKPVGEVYAIDVKVGRYISRPNGRDIVSKEKPLRMYNGVSEQETEDNYTVTWYMTTGVNPNGSAIMKEKEEDQFIKTDSNSESMEDITSFTGIYFSNPEGFLGEDGEIRVYDDETGNLLVTFNKDNWSKYSSNNPYKYEIPVKHVRVETSAVNEQSNIYVYHVKTIDDDKLTSKYQKEQFDKLEHIRSTLEGSIGETVPVNDIATAQYEAPISVANIQISNNTISTQVTEKNEKITIQTEYNPTYNEVRWKNGTFLIKMPAEIIDLELNNVEINNPSVALESYEIIEQDGQKFIKIITKNETARKLYNNIRCKHNTRPKNGNSNKEYRTICVKRRSI